MKANAVPRPSSVWFVATGWHRARSWTDVLHWRRGWLWTAGLALLAGALTLEFTKNRPLGAELATLQQGVVESVRISVAAPALQPAADMAQPGPARAMEVLLSRHGSFEPQYQRLIEIATSRGIELPRAAYVTTLDEAGGLRRVQVSLSLAAGYPQFRSFIEEVLRTLPAVSLDQFAVKRDTVSQGQVDVMVQFSFWALLEPLARPAPRTIMSSTGP